MYMPYFVLAINLLSAFAVYASPATAGGAQEVLRSLQDQLPEVVYVEVNKEETQTVKTVSAKEVASTPSNKKNASKKKEEFISLADIPHLMQESQHTIASKRITRRLRSSHFKDFKFDKNFSAQIYKRYLDRLDYSRLFFTQKDIKSFDIFKYQFTQMLTTGDLKHAYQMFNKLSTRRYQRFQYALSLLDKKMDFNRTGDKYVFDRSTLPWSKNEVVLNEVWRQRVKNDALSLKLTGKKWPEVVEILRKRYNHALKRLSQTQSEDAFQVIMNSFTKAIEPHTSYLSPRSADRFQMDMNLSLEGIGAVLEIKDDYTVIRSLVSGGPADKTKRIKSGDRIIAVGQKTGKLVDVIGWRIEDVVELIKGPKGSTVRLQILRSQDGKMAKPVIVKVIRDKIYLEDRAVQAEVISPESGPFKGKRVGVLKIPSFYIRLSEDTAQKINELKQKDVAAIIVDLRGNGGGVLTEATMLTSLFIGQGPVVQIKDTSGKIIVNHGQKKSIYDGPLVVMVDRYSASASEIFAAAIQDYGRGLIVGDNTFGKGTVQQHSDLGRSYDMYDKPIGFIQYTIAKFYRVNGESTQLKGVRPDIAFPTWLAPNEHGEAEEDNALEWNTIAKQYYKPYNRVNKSIIRKLTMQYKMRTNKDPDFSIFLDMVNEYKLRGEEKYISLVEKERLKEREDNDKNALKRLNAYLKIRGLKKAKNLDDLPKDFKAPDVILDQTVLIALDLSQSSHDHTDIVSRD